MVLPSCRPMVISSRTRGTTVLRPSSSSMISFIALLIVLKSQGLPPRLRDEHPSANACLDGRSEFHTVARRRGRDAFSRPGGALHLGCSVGDTLAPALLEDLWRIADVGRFKELRL